LNTLSLVNVENVNGSDFGAQAPVNDVLNLSTTVNGLGIKPPQRRQHAQSCGRRQHVYQHLRRAARERDRSDDTLTVTGAWGTNDNNANLDLGGGGNDTLNAGDATVLSCSVSPMSTT